LKDVLSVVEKNAQMLQNINTSVTEEIDEIHRRLSKALKDRSDHLRNELERYVTEELRKVTAMKENLEQEITNIQSNSDLAEKHMNDTIEWDDCELMDTKEIFLRTVDFIRNFECESIDYNRRIRFTMPTDPNQLVMHVATFGDLNIKSETSGIMQSQTGMLQPPVGPGLMRSKSDHRLAVQFRQQEAQGYNADEEPLLGGRKFGERPPPKQPAKEESKYGESRYGRGNDYDYDYDDSSSRRGRFKSRFVRGHKDDNDSDNETSTAGKVEVQNKKATSSDDVTKGPLSGIFRLVDSPRVMKRLQDHERGEKKKSSPVHSPTTTKPVVITAAAAAITPVVKKPLTTRQLSEDDEIARIKRQNKGAPSSPVTTHAPEPERPVADRVQALKRPTAASVVTNDHTSDNRRVSAAQSPAPSSPVPAPAPAEVSVEDDLYYSD
jgi:tripartite motif-containing protein 71